MLERGAGSRLLGTSALAGALFVFISATPSSAQEQARSFDIPAESLSSALNDFGRVSGRQVMFTEAVVGNRRSPPLNGTYAPSAALDRLLAGSGLAWRVGASGVVMITPKDTSSPQRTAAAGSADEISEVEQVVVGSRLARPVDGPAPVTIFNRKQIEALGVSNVADILNYLPQQSFSFSEGTNVGGERRVQLRGLATGTTLVLINGRRTITNAASVSRSVFDLNAIPLAAVERVEVLADSASAIYGADAVGGAINIVLKSSIENPVLDVSYGSADGGAEEKRASLSIGGRTDRARGSIVFDYFKRDALLGHERDITNDMNFTRFGGIDRRTLTANPGNICAASGNLPGLSTPCAAVPSGSTGIGLTPSSFLATAGQRNYESRNRFTSIVPSSQRYSAMATGSYDLTKSLSVFGEFMYADRTDVNTYQPALVSNRPVPANNPFNPFGVPVVANFILTGLPTSQDVSLETSYREVVGFKGQFLSWDWEASALGSQSAARYQTNGNVDSARLTAALNAATAAQALNVFQDGPGGSSTLLMSLLADPSTNASTKSSDGLQLAAFVRGSPIQLPAGAMQVVAGAEWRKESISYLSPSIKVTSEYARRKSSSVYAETRLPILGGDNALPVIREVAVTIAGRYDHYDDFGGTFNAQYGAEWRPNSALLLRASYGESFRAPGLYELYRPQSSLVTSALFDPRRGGESIVATYLSGGNPNLDPETSTSSVIGAVWSPEITGRPRLAISAWRIQQDNRIVTGFSSATLLANESYLSERIVRGTPTPGDVAAGIPGRVVSMDGTLLNLGSLDTRGVDFEALARFDTAFGRISPMISATRVSKYQAADFATTPITERVGVANTSGTIPRWKIVGSLGWRLEPLTLTAAARYASGYDDAFSNVRNKLRVSAQTLIDLQASIDLSEALGARYGLAKGVTLKFGAINLFDKSPSFSDVIGYGFDPSQADVRQRYLYTSISTIF